MSRINFSQLSLSVGGTSCDIDVWTSLVDSRQQQHSLFLCCKITEKVVEGESTEREKKMNYQYNRISQAVGNITEGKALSL